MAAQQIVVGVDGSRSSLEALRWALGEARLRGATVDAVQVWHYPALAISSPMAGPVIGAHDDFEADARTLLDEAVDGVLAEVEGAPSVNRVVLEGAAAEQLVRHGHAADLLVLGHRGRGGFADLLLGSVALQCTSHAVCPVVVVRGT
jgi:nucleotide-binding universal stress UspA family protein